MILKDLKQNNLWSNYIYRSSQKGKTLVRVCSLTFVEFFAQSLISASKITGCLTKLNNLLVTLDRSNVLLAKLSFSREALDSPAKMHFWAGCLQFSIPGWNSSQLPLWGFKSESKPVISRAELFAVNWITVAQKGYNWTLQEVVDWT